MTQRLPCVVHVPDLWDLPPFGGRPAILFLHGIGECGDGDGKQLEVGMGPALKDGAAPGHVVLFPQKPRGGEWEDHGDQIEGLLEDVVFEHGVHPEQITLTGLSHGGHGCYGLAVSRPRRWAKIVVCCGYLERWRALDSPLVRLPRLRGPLAERLADAVGDTPVRIFHGTADPAISIEESRAAADVLREAGADVELTELPGLSHNCWDEAYRREFGP